MEQLLKQMDGCFFELGEALKGLQDDNVWLRPSHTLLSVGELLGHIVYWLSIRLAGEGEDLSKCKVQSAMIDPRFRYYDTSLATPPSPEHMSMCSQDVSEEVARIYSEAVSHFRTLSPDLSEPTQGYPGNFTYGTMLEYTVFHIAYHTGQIYSARHLLGETTVDN